MKRQLLLLLSGLALLLAGCTARAPASPTSALLFLAQDAQGRVQLFQTDIDGAPPAQLTTAASSIVDYAIAPGGQTVVYATAPTDGGSVLWQLALNRRRGTAERLHTCADAACGQLVWAPDGRRLIFEQRTAAQPGTPTLWWLNTETGDTLPVLEENAPATSAAISPDGLWLSYISPQTETLVVYNFENGRRFSVQSQVGAPVSWSPDSTHLLVSDLNLVVYHGDDSEDHQEHAHDFAQAINLFVADIYSEGRRPLTNAGEVDDGYAAWSPTQDWIAFGRKPARTANGRQIWLVRPDGSAERPLTDDLTRHHGALSWSGDGRYLLYQRVYLTAASTGADAIPSSIWLYDLVAGQSRKLVDSGAQPAWLAP